MTICSVTSDTNAYYDRLDKAERDWEESAVERQEAIEYRRDEIVESVWCENDSDYNLLFDQNVNDALRDLLQNRIGKVRKMTLDDVVMLATDAMNFLEALQDAATPIAVKEINDKWGE